MGAPYKLKRASFFAKFSAKVALRKFFLLLKDGLFLIGNSLRYFGSNLIN